MPPSGVSQKAACSWGHLKIPSLQASSKFRIHYVIYTQDPSISWIKKAYF